MPDRAHTAALVLAFALFAPVSGATAEPPLSVEIVTDEADAVLALLAVRQAGETPTEAHWRRIFASEGYRRLAAREASLGRPFAEEDFRVFALSDELAARRELLAATLGQWRSADFEAAARRALAYLPAGTTSALPSIR